MTRVHQAASLLLLAFSSWVAWSAWKMTYWTSIGPGPGFFPFWLACIMGLLSVIWFIQLWLRPLPGEAMDMVPSHIGCFRIASLLGSSVLFGVLVERIGFSLTMFALQLFLLTALGRQRWYTTLAIALTGSFGVHYVFTQHLKVPLPPSAVVFLNNLGL